MKKEEIDYLIEKIRNTNSAVEILHMKGQIIDALESIAKKKKDKDGE